MAVHGLLHCVGFDQQIQKGAPLQQGIDADILVETMDMSQVRPGEHRFDPVRGYPYGVQELTVRGTRLQNGQNGDARPKLSGQLLDGRHDLTGQRRGRRGGSADLECLHFDLRVGDPSNNEIGRAHV